MTARITLTRAIDRIMASTHDATNDREDGAKMPSLSSHPIFQIEQIEYSHFKEDSRRNVVAFKGTEVYVAVGSTVRCAELRDDSSGDDSTDKKPYQVFTRLFLLSNLFSFCRHWNFRM